jgi:hypothetical protein
VVFHALPAWFFFSYLKRAMQQKEAGFSRKGAVARQIRSRGLVTSIQKGVNLAQVREAGDTPAGYKVC